MGGQVRELGARGGGVDRENHRGKDELETESEVKGENVNCCTDNNWITFPDKEDRKFRVGLAGGTADWEREQCSGHLRSGGLQARLNSGHTLSLTPHFRLRWLLYFTDSRNRASKFYGKKKFQSLFCQIYTNLEILYSHPTEFLKLSF